MMTPFYFLLHFPVLDPLTRPRLRMHSGHNTIYSADSNVSLLKALKVTNCTVFSSLEGRRPVSFTTQRDSMARQTLSTKRVREFSESQFFGNWLTLLVTLVLNYIHHFQQASNRPYPTSLLHEEAYSMTCKYGKEITLRKNLWEHFASSPQTEFHWESHWACPVAPFHSVS